jgi:hypothetical protein
MLQKYFPIILIKLENKQIYSSRQRHNYIRIVLLKYLDTLTKRIEFRTE